MKHEFKLASFFIIGLLVASVHASAQRTIEVDVCVYGGTSAGVMAAYTTQKLGKKALLIEPGTRLGGMSSGGLGYTDIGNKYAITGLARDFYRRLGNHYGKFEQWIFEPGVAASLFGDYVRRGGYEVLYSHRVKSVSMDGKKISSIVLENADRPDEKTDILVRAKMFVDCGYEGDVMARAGVSYVVGREDNTKFNETINGVQLMDGHQFPDGVDPYVVPGDPSSGLLWGISREELKPDGTGDSKVQAYNYRICLSSDPANQVRITRPPRYDSTRYELALRLFKAFPEKRKLNDYFIWSLMPNGKTDINNRGGFSTDMIGMNYDYPDADYDKRKKIIRDHEDYTRGLLYFFGNDPRVPNALREEMQKWGYPKDEYVENGNWSPQLYVREARRMVGSYVMTQANCEGRKVVEDGVGLAAYTMDSHNCQRLVVNGFVKNEGNVEVGGFGPYPISYRALIPREEECANLLVPVCLSATHIAYGSIRMEPVFMVLAQSAAVAAVMAIDSKTSVQQVDVAKLQSKLKNDPLADGSLFEIMVDNRDSVNVRVTGSWRREKNGGYGPDFLINESARGGAAKVRFTPDVPRAGKYRVYIYFPRVSSSSAETLVRLGNGKRTRDVVVKESDIRVEGQTSGEWFSLGTVELEKGKGAFVEIDNKRSEGRTVADAIILVPAK